MKNSLDENQIKGKIVSIKESLGKKLLILTHHYQRKEIIDLGDFRGDSFGLSQKAAADKDAQFIVFCGVHFMAESAESLSSSHQIVQIPALEAGCWMADLLETLENIGRINVVTVPEAIKKDARTALDRMFMLDTKKG